MSEVGEIFRAIKDEVRLGRELFGIPCPKCLKEYPNAEPTIMTPQRICKRHKKPYQDFRTWKQLAIALKTEQTEGGVNEIHNTDSNVNGGRLPERGA